ncbi:hypothetical protein Tco_1266128 [Tanacetum coccineum]
MITNLKNMGKYNSQLKYKSLEEIQKLYEREQKWINNFVPIDSEEGGKKVESSKKEASSSKKRQKTYPDDENVKRQKLEDAAEKEGLKAYLKIVPDEDRAITRADGSSKFYKVFSMMLEDFDRQDLADLHILVKEMSASRALEGYDLILWGDLKTMLEPIEQKYPLNQEMLTRILNWRLEADFENEMAYELIRFVKSQVQECQQKALDAAVRLYEGEEAESFWICPNRFCSMSAYQKAKNVEEGVESGTWQAAVLVPDGLTFRKDGRMNCGHTAYGMVQYDEVPGWSELLLEHAYSDSQDYCLLDMDCQFQLQTIKKKQKVFDSILYETGSVGDDTNNNKGGNAPIAISSSWGSEVDLDSGAVEPAVAAGVLSDMEPTSL